MAPAVKFFSDVKERFWIKKGAAPYGGSLMLGQVWEGTDNQTRVEVQKCDRREREKQGIVPKKCLDGEALGVPTGQGTAIKLPSGNDRRAGDFEMWFWLGHRSVM